MARIERSRKYISDALLYLLKKNKYQDISINDIITKAGVSRMTFYRQFYDKKEVLKYILDTRTDEYIANHLNSSLSIEERILQGVTMILEGVETDFYYIMSIDPNKINENQLKDYAADLEILELVLKKETSISKYKELLPVKEEVKYECSK